MNNIHTKAEGHFKLDVYDKHGKFLRAAGRTDNVITYAGAFLHLFEETYTDAVYAAIGTGTVERVRSDTGLANESSGRTGGVAGDSADRNGKEVDNGNGTSTTTETRVLSFSTGAKVGTFSEVGVFSEATGGVFVAGQLIKDEFGDPTTITLLSDEQLTITYSLEWTVPNIPQNIGTGTLTDAASNTYNYEVWAQPFWRDYNIGAFDQQNVYSDGLLGGVIAFYDSVGDLITAVDSGGHSVSHNGSGTVTITTPSTTLSPASVTFTNAEYIAFGGRNTTSLIPTALLDISTAPLRPAAKDGAIIMKLLSPITKTSSDSFSLRIQFTTTI